MIETNLKLCLVKDKTYYGGRPAIQDRMKVIAGNLCWLEVCYNGDLALDIIKVDGYAAWFNRDEFEVIRDTNEALNPEEVAMLSMLYPQSKILPNEPKSYIFGVKGELIDMNDE